MKILRQLPFPVLPAWKTDPVLKWIYAPGAGITPPDRKPLEYVWQTAPLAALASPAAVLNHLWPARKEFWPRIADAYLRNVLNTWARTYAPIWKGWTDYLSRPAIYTGPRPQYALLPGNRTRFEYATLDVPLLASDEPTQLGPITIPIDKDCVFHYVYALFALDYYDTPIKGWRFDAAISLELDATPVRTIAVQKGRADVAGEEQFLISETTANGAAAAYENPGAIEISLARGGAPFSFYASPRRIAGRFDRMRIEITCTKMQKWAGPLVFAVLSHTQAA